MSVSVLNVDDFGAFTLCENNLKFGIFAKRSFDQANQFCIDRDASLGPVRGREELEDVRNALADENTENLDFFIGV